MPDKQNNTMSQNAPAVTGAVSGAQTLGQARAEVTAAAAIPASGNGNSGTPGNPTHTIAPVGGATVGNVADHNIKIEPVEDSLAARHVASKQQESADKVAFEQKRQAETMAANDLANQPKKVPASQIMYKDAAAMVDEKL